MLVRVCDIQGVLPVGVDGVEVGLPYTVRRSTRSHGIAHRVGVPINRR